MSYGRDLFVREGFSKVFSKSSHFISGARDCLPILLAVNFFALLFGTTGVNNGLSVWETVLSSAVVFAGASQFVFLDLYGLQAPVWSVLLAVFAVNFRHVLYSASIGRHMGGFTPFQKAASFMTLADPVFAASEQRAQKQQLTPEYYLGYSLPLYCAWVLCTLLGALFGSLITDPSLLGLDMLLPIYFLTLLMSFRSRTNWLPVVLASGIASLVLYRLLGSPWHITIGCLAGILVAILLAKPKSGGVQTSTKAEETTSRA